MQHDEYDRMHALEDEYWWFVARRDLICSLLNDLPSAENRRILDLGCGTGAMLDELSHFGVTIGADFAPEALMYCKERGKAKGREYLLTRADARQLPVQSASMDIITAMDVIEHIDDDKAALREITRALKPGGYFLATVPAFQSLWSEHDIALHHYRRYTMQGFKDVVQRSGLELIKGSYTMTALFPAIWMYRKASNIARGKAMLDVESAKANLIEVPKQVNSALIQLCKQETEYVRNRTLPFGTTVFVVAQKPFDSTQSLMQGAEQA